MLVQPCPACGNETALDLVESSKQARLYYYRCEACGHFWSVSKQDPNRVNHITPLPTKPRPKT